MLNIIYRIKNHVLMIAKKTKNINIYIMETALRNALQELGMIIIYVLLTIINALLDKMIFI